MDFPDKKYAVIYADPPWSYRQHGTGPKSRGNAAQHYHTMAVEDICALPVRQLAGGRARVRAVHVGNFPDHPGCTASHESVGLYIQNRCFRLGEKIQVGRKLLRDGGVYPRQRRSVLAWNYTGIQGERAGKKPFGASNNRVSGASAQRKAGRSPPPHC